MGTAAGSRRRLELFCWSRARLDDPSEEPMNYETVRDLSVDRRCVTCPACTSCDWQAFATDGDGLRIAEGQDSAQVVYDTASLTLKLVGNIKVHYGYGLADPDVHFSTSSDTRVDIFACEKNVTDTRAQTPCPGFDWKVLADEVTVLQCGAEYSDFLCAHCANDADFFKIEGICTFCDGVNYFYEFMRQLLAFVITLFLLHQSTTGVISKEELKHM
jgi:hypothetical protein